MVEVKSNLASEFKYVLVSVKFSHKLMLISPQYIRMITLIYNDCWEFI